VVEEMGNLSARAGANRGAERLDRGTVGAYSENGLSAAAINPRRVRLIADGARVFDDSIPFPAQSRLIEIG